MRTLPGAVRAGPVVKVPAPRVKVMAVDAEAPAVTTVTVPKAATASVAAVLVTATLPTVTEVHAVPHAMEEPVAAAAAARVAK